MFRAVVADDDATFRRLLVRLLESTGSVEVVGQAEDGAHCLQVWEETTPDVLFLDIEMPELGGIEVAEVVLGSTNPPLVAFITGHDEHAARAFDMDAVDYVVKQADVRVLADRLWQMVARLDRALERSTPAVDELRRRVSAIGASLEELARRQGAPGRRLPIKDYEEGTVRLVDPAEVISAERRDRRVVLRTREHEWPTYYTMDALEDRLRHAGFVRVSRSAIVNIAFIEHLIPNGDGSYDLVLRDGVGSVVNVSRSRAKELLSAL
jgi:DNA-binding LytR/AlgR family response regulator